MYTSSLHPPLANAHQKGAPLDAPARRAIAAWLLACCALLFAMIVVGGITRLTHSGLSIVEWQPIVGTVPPLSETQWNETFAKYQATPEFKQVNHRMSIEEFKGIFWWEYSHRLLGRLIGFAFFAPFLYFLYRRWIRGRLAWKLAGIFVLGGLQGAMGWYMVMSGLVDDPRVSQYRLTAHLGIALAIFASMLWLALDLLRPSGEARGTVTPGVRRAALALPVLVFVMALTGGLVAGIHAGLAYNTFPLMNGHFIPPETFLLEPWYLNFFSNMATVQFDHRLLAWALALSVPIFWLHALRLELPSSTRALCHLLLAALALQVTLGISTLLLRVPVPLAAMHQAGAVLLFTAALAVAHAFRGTRVERSAEAATQG
jgi:cytochrome c oxidase assembly protein subunit 15